MDTMKNVLPVFFLTLLGFISFPQIVSADVFNPEYFSKKCNPGEIEVQYSYRSDTPFGPETYNECARYENNPDYRFLAGDGHSFWGRTEILF